MMYVALSLRTYFFGGSCWRFIDFIPCLQIIDSTCSLWFSLDYAVNNFCRIQTGIFTTYMVDFMRHQLVGQTSHTWIPVGIFRNFMCNFVPRTAKKRVYI